MSSTFHKKMSIPPFYMPKIVQLDRSPRRAPQVQDFQDPPMLRKHLRRCQMGFFFRLPLRKIFTQISRFCKNTQNLRTLYLSHPQDIRHFRVSLSFAWRRGANISQNPKVTNGGKQGTKTFFYVSITSARTAMFSLYGRWAANHVITNRA